MFMNIHFKVDSLDGSVVRYIKSIICKYRVDGVGDSNKKKWQTNQYFV